MKDVGEGADVGVMIGGRPVGILINKREGG